MNKTTSAIAVAQIALIGWANVSAQEQVIDASDPTKIYTYAGGGLKYADYTNGESMVEVRATGNIGLSDTDMILFELGYGWHDGNLVPGSNQGLTNTRLRWFRIFNMDYEKARGYRGMGMQVDLQLEGDLKGTNGQNVLSAGIMPTYALGGAWNMYLMLNGVAAWDDKFRNFSGAGVSAAARLVYSPDDWWPGSQIQIIPEYKYFLTGALDGEGDGTLEINVGGEITPTTMWDITGQKNYDLDLRSLQRGVSTGLKNDWNIFINVTTYF
jgi:hypothetical protein